MSNVTIFMIEGLKINSIRGWVYSAQVMFNIIVSADMCFEREFIIRQDQKKVFGYQSWKALKYNTKAPLHIIYLLHICNILP